MTAPPDARVVVVGAGPAGLAAAHALLDAGAGPVLVLERDDAPGGLPRFCGHPGFGWHYTRRIETGRRFARRLLARLEGRPAQIRARTTALAIGEGPVVRVIGPETGPAELRPEAVILATGIFERPRGARLVPGERPERGVYTTGLLQQLETRGVEVASRHIVVAGSEHVAFSVLPTARRCGVRVVALIEPGPRIRSFRAAGALARGLFGARVLLNSRIAEVIGAEQVEGVVVEGPDGSRRIDCDGVLFSGDWVPDNELARAGGLAMDGGSEGPAIDQAMRTSLPGVFAAGNLLHPVEASGIAALEGARAGAFAAAHLRGGLPDWEDSARIELAPELRYLVPQKWAPYLDEPAGAPALVASLRLKHDVAGKRLALRKGDVELWRGPATGLRADRQIRPDLSGLRKAASRLGAPPRMIVADARAR